MLPPCMIQVSPIKYSEAPVLLFSLHLWETLLEATLL